MLALLQAFATNPADKQDWLENIMPSWNEFIGNMALKEWIAVFIIATVAILCREGWRLKKLFGGKR